MGYTYTQVDVYDWLRETTNYSPEELDRMSKAAYTTYQIYGPNKEFIAWLNTNR